MSERLSGATPEFNYLAKVLEPKGPNTQRPPPWDWAAAVALVPELDEFEFPLRGAPEERRAVCDLYKHQRILDEPHSIDMMVSGQAVMIQQQPPARPPRWLLEGKRYPSPIEVYQAVCAVVPDANPGYPAVLTGCDKFEFCKTHFPEVYSVVAARCLFLHYIRASELTPADIVKDGFSDPVLVLLKNEVKKKKKNTRVILVPSVLDEIVERCFIDPADEALKVTWGQHYSCIGIGFEVEDVDSFLDPFQSYRTADSDVPKFDVTRTELEEVLDCELSMFQYGFGRLADQTRAWVQRGILASRSLLVFSDGVVWSQVNPGTQKTGRRVTSNHNTKTRARRAFAVQAYLGTSGPVRAAGDDCREVHSDRTESAYAHLGFPLRDYKEELDGVVEFCSHLFEYGMKPIGVRIVKGVANLLYATDEVRVRFEAFVREYGEHPSFPGLMDRILYLRPGFKEYLFDGQEQEQSKKEKQQQQQQQTGEKTPSERGGASGGQFVKDSEHEHAVGCEVQVTEQKGDNGNDSQTTL